LEILVTIATFTRIAAAAQAGAQSLVNFRIQLVGHQLTAQLNKRIAQLQDQSQDPAIPILRQQGAQLQQKLTAYNKAHGQLFSNSSGLSDLSLQLSNLLVAAQAGNAAQFDTALAAAQTDLGTLIPVDNLAGLQPDGVAPLKFKGLGIQSSATYNLSTPGGQAQAQSDIQAAQAVISQITSSTRQNQAVSDSIVQSLQTQLTGVTTQISNKQITELGQAADEISKLKQKTQEQFHVIELAFGNVGQSAGILSGYQTSQNIDPTPGTVISVLVGQKGPPQLLVATLPPVAAPAVSTSSGSGGVSLTA
jgi:hypothetical protein